MKKQNLLLALAVVILAIIPLCIVKPAGDSEIFGGADGEAEAMISVIRPDYKPWYAPLWEPPSGEIEGLLFALQAALGTGVMCYTIGYFRGKRKANSTT